MQHFDVLGETAGDTVQGAELADTVSGNQAAYLVSVAGVTVSGVGGVQLVTVAHPPEGIGDRVVVQVLQQGQVEVTWHTEHGLCTTREQSAEHVLTEGDLAIGESGIALDTTIT